MRYLLSVRKYSYCLLVLGLLIACKQKEVRKPGPGILSEKEMGIVLADVLLLESYTTKNGTVYDGKTSEVMITHNYPLIDKKYELADSQLIRSYEYYIGDPEAMSRIMNIVIDTLSKIEEELSKTDSSSTLSDSLR